MLSIEKALELYTDKLNAGEQIDLAWFRAQMTAEGFAELQELIPFVKLGKSVKETDKFEKLWGKIDQTNVEFAEENQLPKASGFRIGSGTEDAEAMENLDQIFREEFGDDE